MAIDFLGLLYGCCRPGPVIWPSTFKACYMAICTRPVIWSLLCFGPVIWLCLCWACYMVVIILRACHLAKAFYVAVIKQVNTKRNNFYGTLAEVCIIHVIKRGSWPITFYHINIVFFQNTSIPAISKLFSVHALENERTGSKLFSNDVRAFPISG